MTAKEIKIKTAGEMETKAAGLLEAGASVLASNPRLVRRLIRLHREGMISGTHRAWGSPDVSSFRFFVDRSYEGLWPEKRQLSFEASVLLWMDVLRGSGLPDTRDIAEEFHRAFAALEGNRVEPARIQYDSQNLVRNAVFDAFAGRMNERGLITYAGAIGETRSALERSLLQLPGKIVVIGAEDLLPVERELLGSMAEKTEVVELALVPDSGSETAVELFESFEDEAEVTAGRAISDRLSGIERVAVLYTEQKYCRKMKEIFGEVREGRPNVEGAGEKVSLSETPLFGLVEMALGVCSGLVDENLFALVSTPSFRSHGLLDMDEWGGIATSIRRDGRAGIKIFMDKFGVEKELSPFLHPRAKETGKWIAELREFLGLFDPGSPDKNDLSAGSLEALDDCFRFLEAERGGEVSGPDQFRRELSVACSNASVEAGAACGAGIELMALEEAEGLSFDKIYMVGCRQGALPPPLPKYPLLHPVEKQQMEGLSIGAHFLRSGRLFRSVVSGASAVRLSRPLMDGDTPMLPTPFAPDGEKHGPFNIYMAEAEKVPPRRWLVHALEAAPAGRKAPRLIADEDLPPDRMSVSEATELFCCPFRFFMKKIAKVGEPEEAASLPTPLEWGSEIHGVLEECAEVVRENAGRVPVDELREKLAAKAERCVGKSRLREILKEPVRQFLLGREGKEGLVDKLALFEDERASAGWRIAGEEKWFPGEKVAGVDLLLRGKIDRIDVDAAANRIEVIDYKSGSSVTDAARCQVSLYKKMIESKVAGGLEEGAAAPAVSGGVLPLRNEELRLAEVKPEKDETNIGRIVSALDAMKEGRIPADPFSGNECRSCPYFSLCHIDEAQAGWGVEDE